MNYFLQYDFNFACTAEVEKRVEERKRQKLKEENEGLDQLIEEVSERDVSKMIEVRSLMEVCIIRRRN